MKLCDGTSPIAADVALAIVGTAVFGTPSMAPLEGLLTVFGVVIVRL